MKVEVMAVLLQGRAISSLSRSYSFFGYHVPVGERKTQEKGILRDSRKTLLTQKGRYKERKNTISKVSKFFIKAFTGGRDCVLISSV